MRLQTVAVDVAVGKLFQLQRLPPHLLSKSSLHSYLGTLLLRATMETSNIGALPSIIDAHSMMSGTFKHKMTQDASPTYDGLPNFGPTTSTVPHALTAAPFGSPAMSVLSSVVSHDENDDAQRDSPSSSPPSSLGSDSSSCYHSCHTGWEKTQSLLSERNKMQRKLQRALVGCAEESKRLDQMEVSLRSFEVSKDTSTTCTTRSSGEDESESQSSASSGSNDSAGDWHDSTVVSCDSSDGEDEDVPSQHLESSYLPTGLRSPPISSGSPVVTGRSWSAIYDDMRRLSSQCNTMQRQLDAKDEHIKQLYKNNEEVVLRFARERQKHRKVMKKYESLIRKMSTKQISELSAKDKTIEDQRRQIQDREEVIQKLLDANKKLEVALGAMTTAANNALEEKKKIRDDLKLLRTGHLRDIINRQNEKSVIRKE